MKKQSVSVQDICMIAIMAAVVAVMAQISIPMPLGVPMTMQTFAIALAGILLGSKKGGLAVLVYLLSGLIGLPVFAGFTGGPQALFSVTGGFLISFPLMAFIIGIGSELRHKKRGFFPLFLILGIFSNYLIGTSAFCLLTGSSLSVGLAACVLPFLPTEVLKAVLATVLGLNIQKRLSILQYT